MTVILFILAWYVLGIIGFIHMLLSDDFDVCIGDMILCLVAFAWVGPLFIFPILWGMSKKYLDKVVIKKRGN